MAIITAMAAAAPFLLKMLTAAPAVFDAGKEIVQAVTGQELPASTTPEDLAGRIETLPPEQRAAVIAHVMTVRAQIQALDTDRFKLLTDGDAAKVKATARPEIALAAMRVISTFAQVFRVLCYATVGEWLVRAGFDVFGQPYPVSVSVMSLFSEVAPAAEVLWAPLIASFWVCADVIKKYMGCRERDKAQEYELANGAPLQAGQATIAAAGNSLAGIINAVRGR